MTSDRSEGKASHDAEFTPAEVVLKSSTQPASSPFAMHDALARLDPQRQTALKALAAGQSQREACRLSGLGMVAVKTLKERYLEAIRQGQAALQWKPGSDEVKAAAQRWASQAGAAQALATELVLERLTKQGQTMSTKELAEITTTLTALTRSCAELLRITGGLWQRRYTR